MPDMHWVESSNIDYIGYDEEFEEVWVQFSSGRTYAYLGVPAFVYENFDRSPSKGTYLNQVLKPGYNFREV